MLVERYVVWDPATSTAVGGPYAWDGTTPWAPPEIETNPGAGYQLVKESPSRRRLPDPIPITEQNAATLRDKAGQAFAVNIAYLAIVGQPSAAQLAAQIRALTRQVDILLRLELAAFDTTADT
jgi:hypothetical protein